MLTAPGIRYEPLKCLEWIPNWVLWTVSGASLLFLLGSDLFGLFEETRWPMLAVMPFVMSTIEAIARVAPKQKDQV